MSRTVKEALRIAKSPLRLHQMIARHGYDDGGDVSTGEPMTVPERPETIGMQMRQLVLGKRAGVFVAKGTKGVEVPDGMRVVRTQEGNIVFNPDMISKEEVEESVQEGHLNDILGYVQSKPEALEESLEDGEMPNMVVSRDENGIEQDAAAVSPDRADEQAEIFEDRACGGSTVSVEPLHAGVIRDRMAEGGVPDEESQEKFLKEQLEGSAPQYDPEAGMLTGKRAGLLAAGFAPGSGIASAAGKFPTAEGGFEPSAKEDWKAGNYGSALMKVAGAAGDVAQAVPVVGTAAGAALKAPLAFKLASAMAPAAKIAREAAPVAKAAEEAAGAAKVAEEAKPAYQRLVNPAGFYSRAHEAAMTELPEGERTWQEMHSLLSKAPRVQKEELYWSGIHPETFDPKQKVTREQIGEMIEKNFPKVSPLVKSNISEKELGSVAHGSADHDQLIEREMDRLRDDMGDDYHDLEDHEQDAMEDEFQRQATRIVNDRIAAAGPASGSRTSAGLPMHEQYTVPGGENYNERILTHEYNDPNRSYVDPEVESKYADEMSRLMKQSSDFARQADAAGSHAAAGEWWEKYSQSQNQIRDLSNKIREESSAAFPEYTKGHFYHHAHLGDINNPILHTRNSERTIPGRGKVWHQEEVQSDWAQQGREQGFKDPIELKKAEKRHNEIMDEKTAIDKQYAEQHGSNWQNNPDIVSKYLEQTQALSDEENKLENLLSSKGLSAAPHVRDTEHWLDLAAKDTLKNAIEGGHDHIFITGGQEQAKRWSNELRKAVDNVRWESPNPARQKQDAAAAMEQLNANRDRWSNEIFGMSYSDIGELAQGNIDQMITRAKQMPEIPDLAPERSKVVYARPVGSDTEHRFVVKQVEGPNGKPRVEVVDSSIPSAKGETLSAVLGNDLAKRIMSEESGEQAMNGYRMGSEGYSQTYERKYPSSFKKLIKQLDPDAKIEAGPLELKNAAPSENARQLAENEFISDYINHEMFENYDIHGIDPNELSPEDLRAWERQLEADARNMIQANPEETLRDYIPEGSTVREESVHGTWIPITPKMRENYNKIKAQHGSVFPAYERGGRVSEKGKQEYSKTNWHYPRKSIQGALAIARKVTDR